jgi:hypothetical protein
MHLAENVLPTVTAHLAANVLPTVTVMTVPHVTLVETVPDTTKTKHLVAPHLTSTLQRTRRHASLLRKTSFSSVSKLKLQLRLMSMA